MVPDDAHNAGQDNPGCMNQRLREFLASVRGRTGLGVT